MHQKSNKIIFTAVITLFIFSMFFASVPLALAAPSLTLKPTSGPSGTVVTVTGSGFFSGIYRVYFDKDGDERYDWGEPYKTVSRPDFTTTLTVPPVASGIYYVRADVFPYHPAAIASSQIKVTVIIDVLMPQVELDLSPVLDAIGDLDGSVRGWTTIVGALDDIKGEIEGIDITGLLTTDHFDDVIGNLTIGGERVWTDLASALGDIKTEIEGIQTDVTSILGYVDDIDWSDIDGILGYVDDINWTDVTAIKDAVLSDEFGLEEIKAEIEAIDLSGLLTKTYFDTIFTVARLNNIDLLDDIWGAVDTMEADLKTWMTSNIVNELVGDIATAGSTWGWTDLASALADIKDEIEGISPAGVDLTPILNGDVIASKHEIDRTMGSTSPYTIGGLGYDNKVFMGRITLETNTGLSGGTTLSIEVYDGDSWIKLWTSANNPGAGTVVSMDVTGITDSSGNAIKITTTSSSSITFDYIFAYQIDIG